MNSFLEHKIVIYDSGIGGKSIFEKILKFSNNSFYFVDSNNFPYGTKTFQELKIIFLSNLDKLNLKKGDLLVLACNTISCVYLQLKEELDLDYQVITVLDLVIDKNGLIICTQYTSNYLNKIGLLNQPLVELACLIEKNDEKLIYTYLKDKKFKETRIIYGCTHYPVIDKLFKKMYPEKIFVNPEAELIKNIEAWISRSY